MPRRFPPKAPSKASQRAALLMVLTYRDKPLDDAAKASLARSYGLSLAEVERVGAEVAAGRGRVA